MALVRRTERLGPRVALDCDKLVIPREPKPSIPYDARMSNTGTPVITRQDLQQGAAVLSLNEEWSDWVHRRVEQVTLADPSVSERRVSVDFTLAPDPETPAVPSEAGPPRYLVPVTWITKHRITNFSLRDETGRALPVLTQRQTAVVASAMLAVAAADIAQATLDRAIGSIRLPKLRDHF